MITHFNSHPIGYLREGSCSGLPIDTRPDATTPKKRIRVQKCGRELLTKARDTLDAVWAFTCATLLVALSRFGDEVLLANNIIAQPDDALPIPAAQPLERKDYKKSWSVRMSHLTLILMMNGNNDLKRNL
ncbi:hypothetical protein HDU98_002654 [Podochytrium sp. JEL0797]|nr:hypothetical protein HDU98_002654 [Podochytrium sp. JEL0797]